MLLRHAIGATLRRIRLDAGRTLRDVSTTAAISMPYLSEIERGRKEPSSEILAGILTALGVTLVDLLREVAGEQEARERAVVDLAAARSARIAVGTRRRDGSGGAEQHEVAPTGRSAGPDVSLAA